MAKPRSDARQNLIDAITCATSYFNPPHVRPPISPTLQVAAALLRDTITKSSICSVIWLKASATSCLPMSLIYQKEGVRRLCHDAHGYDLAQPGHPDCIWHSQDFKLGCSAGTALHQQIPPSLLAFPDFTLLLRFSVTEISLQREQRQQQRHSMHAFTGIRGWPCNSG